MKTNVVSLAAYKKKNLQKKKNLTWLYSLSEFELITEFIESHTEAENHTSDTHRAEWLDTVSDVVSVRFFNTNRTEGSL